MASPNSTENQGYQRDHYERRHPRINKPDMFMNTALWMEMSPLADRPPFHFAMRTESDDTGHDQRPQTSSNGGNPVKQDSHDEQKAEELASSIHGRPIQQETVQPEEISRSTFNLAGAVFVLPNDRALSVDCSRDGVHAAVRALIEFGQERAKGCDVYLSRRPCSYCAKLLVQCEVKKVYYLPIEPEWNDPDDISRVDNMFKACSTGLSIFIPKVSKSVLSDLKERKSLFVNQEPGQEQNKERFKSHKEKLIRDYWGCKWIEDADKVLRWPAFTGEMKTQTNIDMDNLLEWIARATYGDVPDNTEFAKINPKTKKAEKSEPSGEEKSGNGRTQSKDILQEVPVPSDPNWQRHALHMSRLAQMLSQRSDDPTRRVGCVLMLHNKVVAIGWNGFPAKALYGEFPRASHEDTDASQKKEPYVIHAEQNALLTRNKRNMTHDSSILFCNYIPARECVPMLLQAGVKHVVVPVDDLDKCENKAFYEALREADPKLHFEGYWPKD